MTRYFGTGLLAFLLSLSFLLESGCKRGLNMDDWPVAEQNQYEIIYDEYHAPVWGIWDTGYSGYSEITRILRERGMLVSCSTEPLDSLIKKIAPGSMEKKILFLGTSKQQEYSRDEISAVSRFIDNGGKLLVLTERSDGYNIANFQNELLRKYNLIADTISEYKPEMPTDMELRQTPLHTSNFHAFSTAFGLKNVFVQSPCTVWCRDNCVTLLQKEEEGKKHTLGAGYATDRGRIVLLGNSKFLINADTVIGINRSDNRQFFIDCIQWLIGKRLVSAQQRETRITSSGSGTAKGTIFIDTGSLGRGIDESVSGLKSFAELLAEAGYDVTSGPSCKEYTARIIAGPVAGIEPGFDQSKKLILFAESFTQLSNLTFEGKNYLFLQAVNPKSIYAHVEELYNFSVIPCFITDGDRDLNPFSLEAPLSGMRIPLNRCGAIESVNRTMNKTALPPGLGWGDINNLGFDELNSSGIPNFEAGDIRSPVWLAYNSDLLVIGDSDMISNQNADKPFFRPFARMLIGWLQGGRL